MTLIITALLLVGMHLISAQTIVERKNIPPAIIYGDGSSSCPSEQQRATSRQEIKERVASALDIQPPHQCGAGEWIRVAYLDMKDPLQTCPSAWTELNNMTSGVRVCGRPPSSTGICHGTFYSAGGRTFTKVCGRVIGYQVGHPDAFRSFQSINSVYVEGVSITYGSPRAHIWTYAADTSETSSDTTCPCDTGSSSNPPLFVGNNYYCESGNQNRNAPNHFLYADDPLWDGKQCGIAEGTCCSDIDGRSPPWFSVTLNNPTNDSIEVRICASVGTREDTPIELLEIYIL
jgi:hypothetical protein